MFVVVAYVFGGCWLLVVIGFFGVWGFVVWVLSIVVGGVGVGLGGV